VFIISFSIGLTLIYVGKFMIETEIFTSSTVSKLL